MPSINLLNTFWRSNGASIASNRLFNALKSTSDIRFICSDNIENNSFTISQNFAQKIRKTNDKLERFTLQFTIKDISYLSRFSSANVGFPPRLMKNLYNTDIIHLHWLNQGFISLRGLKKIIRSGKPIVWTLHDMWAFTGGCHYTSKCSGFLSSCGNCPMLRNPSSSDLSSIIFKRKYNIYKDANINIVTCSNWLKEKAQNSALLANKNVISIPNPINTELYKPIDKKQAKEKLKLPENKRYILFASGNIFDKRKGIKFLVDAFRQLAFNKNKHLENTEILLFGKAAEGIKSLFPVKVNYLGILKSEETIINAYNAADVFVLPSLEDNLPNTIMEALSCGVPCLAFNSGGIPEMIKHKETGYLAQHKSSDDLAEGLSWILDSDIEELSKNARQFVLDNYSEDVVAEKYMSLYKSLI